MSFNPEDRRVGTVDSMLRLGAVGGVGVSVTVAVMLWSEHIQITLGAGCLVVGVLILGIRLGMWKAAVVVGRRMIAPQAVSRAGERVYRWIGWIAIALTVATLAGCSDIVVMFEHDREGRAWTMMVSSAIVALINSVAIAARMR